VCVCLKAQFEEASRANELTSQLTQQTEYSASMGAACATLLWRVSRRDDAVESLLSGVRRFFLYSTGWPKKLAPFLHGLTLPNINRFSKLFSRENMLYYYH